MPLAETSSNLALGIAVMGILVDSVIVFVLWGMSRTVQKYDRLEDHSNETIKTMEANLHAATTKLIDERFRGISHEVRSHAQAVIAQMDEMRDRLKDGDAHLGELSESDHRAELKFRGCLDEIKDWIRGHCATREDVKEHEKMVGLKFDRISEQMGQMSRELAVVADRQGK
jgi:hypothetical protein